MTAENFLKLVEAEHDLDGPGLIVELDGVLDYMVQDVLENIPVSVGPAWNFVDLDDFDGKVFVFY